MDQNHRKLLEKNASHVVPGACFTDAEFFFPERSSDRQLAPPVSLPHSGRIPHRTGMQRGSVESRFLTDHYALIRIP